SIAEGLDSGAYFYLIIMLYVIPFIIEDSAHYKKEAFSYFIITAASIAICVIYSGKVSNWQNIPPDVVQIKYYSNCIFLVFLSAAFAYLSIHFEKKHARALIMQKLKAEEASIVRSRFLSNVGHELRTPLNGIIGAINLLDKNTSLKDQSEYLNIVKYSSDHMLQLVNDILDFNKIEIGQLELHPVEFNLKNLLNNSVLNFHHRFEEKGISLLTEFDDKLDRMVHADDLRLIQIFNILLSNSLKFTEKGYVKLGSKVQEISETEILVDFFVEDTGMGIEEGYQQKIFESFEQLDTGNSRKNDGTGLGLSIGLRLLKLMDSKLKVQSFKGVGSKFYFTLKLELVSEQGVLEIEKIDKIDIAGKNILIAEDNVINMIIATKTLTNWNANVTAATNGLEALNAVKENPDFNIILLDLGMPEMDGYEAIREIKKIHPHIPVLAFTAALMDNDMHHSLLSIGFADSILKPFKPQDLLSKIKHYSL
ncbi:MAG: response regulator, partial [Pyrinomonadaceae bacterium]|nr:response regulator [Sphingobacteriaceae bacterium]